MKGDTYYVRGSTTLWVVVFLVIFSVLLTASLQFINRQSHATIVQEQEDQAFAAAEAGIHHVLWLLNSGTQTISSLTRETIVNEPITNSTDEIVARFSITFSEVTASSVSVTSVGSDATRLDVCQSITADIQTTSAGGFVVSRWDNAVTPVCAAATVASSSAGDDIGVATATLALQDQTVVKPLTATEATHRYIISVLPVDVPVDVRIKVRSTSFTPTISLRDPSGVEVAYAGQEWSLAHVRYEATLRRWQESLSTSIRGGTRGPTCDSSQYLACIPADLETHGTWFTLSSPGLYQLDVSSIDSTRGTYTLETDKR